MCAGQNVLAAWLVRSLGPLSSKKYQWLRMADHAYLLLWVAVLFVIFQAPLILSKL
jgi:hypothetical protein